MESIKAAAKIVEQENADFGYVASKIEVANDVWSSHMTPAQRYEVMQSVDLNGLKQLEALRKCVKVISEMM